MARTIDLGKVVGDRGPQGAEGPQGPQGLKGDKGDKGDPGVSICDDHFDNTSTYPVQNKVISVLIPAQATAGNKLTDKDFVNSSIATNTAFFRGTSEAGLTEEQFLTWANGLTKTNNDYVFWNTTDTHGNVVYKRYKFNGTNWVFEYALNNSSFTAEQWAALNSGLTSSDKTKIDEATTLSIARNALWPIGSVFITIYDTDECPLGFGTWEKIAQGKCLFGADTSHTAGSDIPQGLPKPSISHNLATESAGAHTHTYSTFFTQMMGTAGAGVWIGSKEGTTGSAGNHTHTISGNISIADDDTYKAANTVIQPPAVAVVFWKRTA